MFAFEGAHPVLQQGEWVAVWGNTSLAGTRVDVSLDNRPSCASVVAGADGAWLAHLPPQPPQWGVTLTASVAGGPLASTVVDFGVVVLCSGQSNMQVRRHFKFAPLSPCAAPPRRHSPLCTGHSRLHCNNSLSHATALEQYTRQSSSCCGCWPLPAVCCLLLLAGGGSDHDTCIHLANHPSLARAMRGGHACMHTQSKTKLSNGPLKAVPLYHHCHRHHHHHHHRHHHHNHHNHRHHHRHHHNHNHHHHRNHRNHNCTTNTAPQVHNH